MTAYEHRLRVRERVAVVDRPDADAIYVARVPDGPVLAFNGTGPIIWQLMADGLTGPEITAAFVEATGESTDVVEPAVRDFLERLVADGLVEVAPGG